MGMFIQENVRFLYKATSISEVLGYGVFSSSGPVRAGDFRGAQRQKGRVGGRGPSSLQFKRRHAGFCTGGLPEAGAHRRRAGQRKLEVQPARPARDAGGCLRLLQAPL